MFSYFAIKGKLAISIRIEPSDNRDAIKRKKVKKSSVPSVKVILTLLWKEFSMNVGVKRIQNTNILDNPIFVEFKISFKKILKKSSYMNVANMKTLVISHLWTN